MKDLQALPSDLLTEILPDHLAGAPETLRAATGVSRILFAPGPGDVFGTWRHWTDGRDDPSIPSVGYSHQIYELANRLGAQLTVLSEHPLPPDAPTAKGAPVRFVHAPNVAHHGARYHLGRVLNALGLVRRAAMGRADVIICQKHLDHFWPLAFARLLRIRVVVSLHNSLWPVHRAPSRRDRILGALNGRAFRFLGRPVICVSGAVRDQVVQVTGRENTACVQIPQYPGTAQSKWRPRPADRPARHLLYVGRIEDNKGIFTLLDAFKKLAAVHPDATLRYLGDGGHLAALRAAIAAAGLGDRVTAPGQATGAEVFSAMAQTDLLVCPTTTRFAEGLAKTPIEAALCGVPSVLSTTVPCVDLLGDAARVFRADDVADLHRVLDDLLRHPETLTEMNAATRTRRAIFYDGRRSLAAQLYTGLTHGLAHGRAPARPGAPRAGTDAHPSGRGACDPRLISARP
ncbi:MAG: glycogen(starch) synthase [Paracoccaceae bacterium]|jgi:glycogen(starch) synthase